VDIREMVRIGIKSLVRHKLRTLLTMLGVIFGVAAVISMMSIGEGARRASIEQIKLLGTNNIRIKQVEKTVTQEESEESPSEGLSYQDAREMADKIPGAVAVSPIKFVEEMVFAAGKAPACNAAIFSASVSATEVSGSPEAMAVKRGRFLCSAP